MKISATLYLVWLLLAAYSSRAQVVIQGDSSYLGLQPGKDSLASVVARLGGRYRRTELYSWYTAKMRSGGCISGTKVTGYALRYKKQGVVFCVDNKPGYLNGLRFQPAASVISSQGIRPGAASFADVINKYGLPIGSDQKSGEPRVGGFWEINKRGERKRCYMSLDYPRITFISKGKRVTGENLLARRVQEIWLW